MLFDEFIVLDLPVARKWIIIDDVRYHCTCDIFCRQIDDIFFLDVREECIEMMLDVSDGLSYLIGCLSGKHFLCSLSDRLRDVLENTVDDVPTSIPDLLSSCC